VATALLVVTGLLQGCGGDPGSAAFGSFDSASDSNEFNLEDVQPDWWPKVVPGFTAQDRPVLNQLDGDARVVGGNEHKFLALRNYGVASRGSNEVFTRSLQVSPGRLYQGYVYFHNSGIGSADDTTSLETRISLALPSLISGQEVARATVSSKNGTPAAVNSTAVVKSGGKGTVALRVTSATVYMQNSKDSYSVPVQELISKRGALVGCGVADGRVISGDNCWGQLTFVFEAVEASMNFTARVAFPADQTYSNSLTVSPRDGRVDVGFRYENTGKVPQTGVSIGYYATNDGTAGKVLPESAILGVNDSGWSGVTLSPAGVLAIGTVKAQESTTLQLSVQIDDWNALCRDGQLAIIGTTISDAFYRTDARAYVYPDPSYC